MKRDKGLCAEHMDSEGLSGAQRLKRDVLAAAAACPLSAQEEAAIAPFFFKEFVGGLGLLARGSFLAGQSFVPGATGRRVLNYVRVYPVGGDREIGASFSAIKRPPDSALASVGTLTDWLFEGMKLPAGFGRVGIAAWVSAGSIEAYDVPFVVALLTTPFGGLTGYVACGEEELHVPAEACWRLAVELKRLADEELLAVMRDWLGFGEGVSTGEFAVARGNLASFIQYRESDWLGAYADALGEAEAGPLDASGALDSTMRDQIVSMEHAASAASEAADQLERQLRKANREIAQLRDESARAADQLQRQLRKANRELVQLRDENARLAKAPLASGPAPRMQAPVPAAPAPAAALARPAEDRVMAELEKFFA